MDLRSLTSLSPFLRVAIASAPILITLLVRLMVGNNRALPAFLMGSATWLAMNIVIAPQG